MTRRTRLRIEALEDRCLPSFSPAVSYPVGPNPRPWSTADFNNDGQLDLVDGELQAATASACCWATATAPSGHAVNYATGAGPLSLAVGDFDGDLDLDLATAN